MPCWINNISAGGVKLTLESISLLALEHGRFRVEIPGYGTFPAEQRWRAGPRIGAAFRIQERTRLRLADKLLDNLEPRA